MKLTDTEWIVMKVIWRRHPASARDVLEAVEEETSWAYTTVKTILDRLVEKGVLNSRLRANTTLYSPLLSEEKARRSALKSLADRAFDGAFAPLVHFLVTHENLSEEEKRELGRLLKDENRRRS